MTELFDSPVEFRKLAKSDDRDSFDCGDDDLNVFLRRFARQNQSLSIGIAYIASYENQKEILGYYTLSSGQILFQDVPKEFTKRLPRYPIPIAKIGRLARDVSVRGKGMGELLLVDALNRVLRISDELGIYGVEVDAKDEYAKAFYERFGFQELLDEPLHLFMSMKIIKKAFSAR